jgi:putative tryptophan/tyrosine transport system substrate-binding protein
MKRRDFMTLLGGAVLASSRGARAQQPAKVWRVGIIAGGNRVPAHDGLLQGMHELGHVSGLDYITEWRFAGGRYTQFGNFAQDLVQRKTDVIFVSSASAVDPVRQVTRTIPIVMGYSTDPVAAGYAASLARPGGNTTGLASSPDDSDARHLALLKAIVPGLARVGALINPETSDFAIARKNALAEAQKAGLELVWADARVPNDIDAAFAALAGSGVQAVRVIDDFVFLQDQRRLAEHALKHRLPTIYSERDYVQAGGLISYGENMREYYRRAASYVDRIIKGARAGDLAIELPGRQIAINRKTARALGLTIPPDILGAANEVID